MPKLVYPELSYKIVGALFNVSNTLGSGYQEKYYQRALVKEWENRNLRFEKERPITLQYGAAVIGRHFLDFIIENKIVLEVKAVRELLPKDFRQLLGYLKSTNKKLGIIANFGHDNLEYKRIINRDYTGRD